MYVATVIKILPSISRPKLFIRIDMNNYNSNKITDSKCFRI